MAHIPNDARKDAKSDDDDGDERFTVPVIKESESEVEKKNQDSLVFDKSGLKIVSIEDCEHCRDRSLDKPYVKGVYRGDGGFPRRRQRNIGRKPSDGRLQIDA